MEQLQNIYEFLKKTEKNTLEVWDLPSDERIHQNYKFDLSSYEAFKAQVKSFMETYGKIGLQKMKSQGSANHRVGGMVHVVKKQNTDVDRGGVASNPLPSQHQNYMGMNGAQGLSYADIGKLTQFDEVKDEKKRLQEKYELIKDKNSELEKEILKITLGKESKPGTIEKLLENPEVLTQLATVLGQAISKGGAATQQLPQGGGMNAPQLSQIKQRFITDLVQMNPEDSVVMRLVYLLKCYAEGKTEVITEFEKLYKDATSQHQQQ